VEAVGAAFAVDGKDLAGAAGDFCFCAAAFRVIIGDCAGFLGGEVIGEGGWDDEVAIGEALHEGAGSEAVGAVVREVGFAEDVESGEVAHEVVVDPEAAHGVMDGGVDAHGDLVGVFARDLFVHLEEVAVAFLDGFAAEAFDGVREVEVDAEAAGSDAAAIVALFLGGAAGDVAWGEVAEAGVFAFEVVVAVFFRDAAGRFAAVFLAFGDPAAAVVAE